MTQDCCDIFYTIKKILKSHQLSQHPSLTHLLQARSPPTVPRVPLEQPTLLIKRKISLFIKRKCGNGSKIIAQIGTRSKTSLKTPSF